MSHIINVNRNILASNKKHNRADPAISVRATRSGKATYCRSVAVSGTVRVIQDEANPLPCGARIWIEADGEIEIQP